MRQRGVNKIKAGYLKRLTKPLKTVGVIEENKAEGYVVTGGFVHTGNGDQAHVSFSLQIPHMLNDVHFCCNFFYLKNFLKKNTSLTWQKQPKNV